jgi:hypothetical protein
MNDQPSAWVQFVLIASGAVAFLGLLHLPMIVRWHKVARLYPDGPFTAERVYQGVSGSLTGAVRGCSHHLAVGKQGIRLFGILPLQRFCPPILIPWKAIYSLQGKPSTFFGSDSLLIEVSGAPMALGFSFLWRHGNAISVIQQYWEEGRAAARAQTADLQSKSNPIVFNRA